MWWFFFNVFAAAGIVYWLLEGEELPMTDVEVYGLFVLLLVAFELGRLHRKVNLLSKPKRRKHIEVNWKERQEEKE